MRAWATCVLALACGAAAVRAAAAGPGGVIYTCRDDQGNPITRDRYIVECRHKEQRILNGDGSLRQVVPPTWTPEEQAQREAETRKKRESEQGRNVAIQSDSLLLKRFPDKITHDRAREAALNDSRFSIQSAEARLRELDAERKGLLQEDEFYRGRRMLPALRQQLDANEAAAAAQRNAIKNAQAEQQRINDKFDAQLERLRKLWGGAQPGTQGPPVS